MDRIVLALFIVGVSVVSAQSVKPGTCPAHTASSHCNRYCNGDSECEGTQKCCSNGCGTECMNPSHDDGDYHHNWRHPISSEPHGNHLSPSRDVTYWNFNPASIKPGSCPARPAEPLHCDYYCNVDSDCEGTQKCCSYGCGTECVEQSHFGGYYFTYSSWRTASSSSSQEILLSHIRNRKYTLLQLVSIRPGSCPARPAEPLHCDYYCNVDSDCEGIHKCCSNGCGAECVDQSQFGAYFSNYNWRASSSSSSLESQLSRSRNGIYSVRTGTCPARPATPPHCNSNCNGDSDCGGNQKCCSNGCGTDCVDQSQVSGSQGKCPARPAVPLHCNNYCNVDSDCERTQKCCSNGCGTECIDLSQEAPSKNGTCPVLRPGETGDCNIKCNSNSQCPGNQICCGNGCGKECKDPVSAVIEAKTGNCPAVRRSNRIYCGVKCNSDSQCPGNQKCCSNGCGLECKDTSAKAPAKRGKCPSIVVGQVADCSVKCTTDSECSGRRKCCPNGCGKECKSPTQTTTATTATTACIPGWEWYLMC